MGIDDIITAMAVFPDGKIIAVGNSTVTEDGTGRPLKQVGYVRYNADGSLDQTFADEGIGFVRFVSDSTRNEATSVVARADGSSVIGGFAAVVDPATGMFDSYFALVGIAADGTVDGAFGDGGRLATDLGAPAAVTKVDFQTDGKIVAGGSVLLGTGVDRRVGVALVRYDPGGTLDPTFLNDGVGLFERDFTPVASVGAAPAGGTFVTPSRRAAEPTSQLTPQDLDDFIAQTQGVIATTPGGKIRAGAGDPAGVNAASLIALDAAPAPDGPDLTISVAVTPAGSVLAGKRALASAVVRNAGNAVAASWIAVRLVLSSDPFFDPGDAPLAESNKVLKLAPGDDKLLRVRFAYPAGVAGGTYYVLARADAAGVVAERDESNNDAAAADPVDLAPATIDLSGRITSPPTPGAGPGRSRVGLALSNGGNITARGKVAIALYLSVTREFDPATAVALPSPKPVRLGVMPGGGRPVTVRFVIPQTVPAGSYYLHVLIDPESRITESNESNNMISGDTPFLTIA